MAAQSDSYAAYTVHEPEGPGPIGFLALVLAWAVPGLGHILLGHVKRGLVFLVTIHLLFAAGLLVAGIRAINPQDQAIWTYTQFLTGWPMVIANKVEQRARPLWLDDSTHEAELRRQYEQQTPFNESLLDRQARAKAFLAAHPLFVFHPKVQDMGAVYCGIAGMLNLLVMFDVLLRITGSVREDPATLKKKRLAEMPLVPGPTPGPGGAA